MDALITALQMDVVQLPEILLRVGLALLFGLALGFDREEKDKPIDYRAYMIVGTATCILGIMGQEVYADYARAGDVVSVDLAKIIAGVLTGIGFLGAGAIIKVEKEKVIGTTTGASIWASGGIGLCLGFGQYMLALVAFIVVFVIMIAGNTLFDWLDRMR
ncbi:MAG: MgtC/SapB family protein [Wenzhouxiangellaceae bacterium]|nr:MgtC/SapB family protein [Wenzhouxiangellaceae bacterium]